MDSVHPSRQDLETFMRGDLAPEFLGPVLRHLLSGCAACQEVTRPLWLLGQGDDTDLPMPALEAAEEAAYDEVIDRVLGRIEKQEAVIAREVAQARERYEELMRHPAARQQLLVGNCARFRSRRLCELLLEKSHEAGFQTPARAVELARLAVTISGFLEQEAVEAADLAVRRNLAARSWAQLGNALRINSDLGGAEEAFEVAESLLTDAGRSGQLDRARVLDLTASLRRDQGHYAEAFRLHDGVIAIYQKLGQWHLLGRAMAQKAIVCGVVGDSEGELGLLRRALDLLDPQEEPRMFLAARHNLIMCLTESGRHREAFSLLFNTRPLYLQTGDRMNLLRLRWMEGLVAFGLGRVEQAEVAFREVREAFVELGLAYDAALAALDLATLYADQGRTAEVRRLAEEMLTIFQSRNIHREAMAALLVFRRAAEMEQAGAGLVREVSAFLKRARNNPDLRFAPPS